jgi:hypothetical protein
MGHNGRGSELRLVQRYSPQCGGYFLVNSKATWADYHEKTPTK